MNVLEMTHGDDEVFEITVIGRTTQLPIDITGCTLVLTARETPKSAIVIQKTFTPSDPVNGKAEVTIDAADTASLSNEYHEYIWDVEITKVTGKKETLCSGLLRIDPEVTY